MTIKEMENKRVVLFSKMIELKEKLALCEDDNERIELMDELHDVNLEYKRFGSIIRELIWLKDKYQNNKKSENLVYFSHLVHIL